MYPEFYPSKKWLNKPIQKCSMEVGPINPAEPSPRLADAPSLYQVACGHHAGGGRQLPRFSTSTALLRKMLFVYQLRPSQSDLGPCELLVYKFLT